MLCLFLLRLAAEPIDYEYRFCSCVVVVVVAVFVVVGGCVIVVVAAIVASFDNFSVTTTGHSDHCSAMKTATQQQQVKSLRT